MIRKSFFLLLSVFVSALNSFGQSTNGFSSVSVSSGWTQAIGLSFNKTGNRMFVWEKAGKVWFVENSQKKLLIDISAEVANFGDLGLVGFALHPQFETNGYFYLLYTVDRHHLKYYGTSNYSSSLNEYNNATIGRLTRYTATRTSSGYSVSTLSRKILIGATKTTGIPVVFNSHHVGSLVFGTDGTLLISVGDAASSAVIDTGSASGTYYRQALADGIIKTQENVGSFRAQLLESYNGKILRIDPATGKGIASNPFYESTNPGSVRSKVWALGFRNPFRMSLRPGTGSTNPADGNPGVIYVGDVGWKEWEEVDVVKKRGANFGWPLFEGLTRHSILSSKLVYNYYAPNPLYGINGCSQKYFYFKDLIKQETASGTATFSNPCDRSHGIPSNVKTFVHNRPVIDWKQPSGPSRTGTFNGETASVINIGAAGSPVSGPQFGGASVIGGVFYTRTDFPASYQNTYFFGDYVKRWIRSIAVDGTNKPLSVTRPVDSGRVMVALASHPSLSGIYYINYGSEIRKITYNVSNRPPVAVASSDKNYGPSPLTVQFKGSGSSDPDGQTLTYLWNFGDGTTSTAANPSHSFTTSTNTPTKFTVNLTVKDTYGSKDSTTLIISANNTPPQVTITSPVEGTLYSLTSETNYDLRATVSDKESSDGKLSYKWQTILHHEDHEHADPTDTSRITSTTISPLGCESQVYYYAVSLTVTDPAGLSTTKQVRVYPNCSQRVSSFTLVNADNDSDIKTLTAGETINLASLPTKNINIRANTVPSKVGSVKFKLTGPQTRTQTESTAPYALYSDVNGNYNSWNPVLGTYTLQATPYSASGATGTVGSALVREFKVINQTASSRPALNTDLPSRDLSDTEVLVAYYPNPFENQFTLKVLKKQEKKLPVRIYDIQGRAVLQLADVQPRQTLALGKELAPGVYVLEVGTGMKAKRFRMIKISR